MLLSPTATTNFTLKKSKLNWLHHMTKVHIPKCVNTLVRQVAVNKAL